MKQFNPPIAERSTTELIIIALDERGEWHPDAMDQAKEELRKRKVSYEEKINVASQYNRHREQQEAEFIEKKKNEPLSAWEIIHLLHTLPFGYFAYRSHKANGYDYKAQQTLLIVKIVGAAILVMIGLVLLG